MKILFQGIEEDKLKQNFTEVMETYTKLHDFEVILEQRKIKNTTMQAQPIINFNNLIKGIKQYKISLAIHIRDSPNAKVEDLPSEVIRGWFAHELGHLIDYCSYNNWKMIQYGIKYISSKSFKKEIEHRADRYAIDHGFGEDIIAAKKFIFKSPLFGSSYKQLMKDYYMSIEEVEARLSKGAQ